MTKQTRKPQIKWFLFFSILFGSNNFYAELDDYLRRDPGPTSSNYGETGLLEIPTARFLDEGTFKIGLNSSFPYEMTAITTTPFSWLEATFRYTEVKNQKYGPVYYSGNQTLKDKAFDFKLKLVEETSVLPSIALGMRDIGGTGLFSSEYFVATKNFGPLDLTLGVGWGQLGRIANIKNPFSSIHDSFKRRSGDYGEGGALSYNSWFSGEDVGLFGGMEYRFKHLGTRLKIEYDSSSQDRASYPLVPIEISSKINYGFSFPIGQWGEYSFGYQRGNTYQFSFFLKTNYGETGLVPKLDPPPNLARLNENQKKEMENQNSYYRTLLTNLNKNKLYLQAANKTDNKVQVLINQNKYRSYSRATGRAARIVASLSPDDVEVIEIFHMNGNQEMAAVALHKDKFLSAAQNEISSEELLLYSDISSPGRGLLQKAEFKPRAKLPDWTWKMGPALRSHIGGPEAFFMGQLWWKMDLNVMLTRGLTFYTTIGLNIYDNFEFRNPSDSELPHVRSDIQKYLKEGKSNISRMKLDYLWSPGKDLYARFDFGLMEDMFGGYGGEILYRPYKSKFAIGFFAHSVKQRDYDQRFTFRDYSVETGFLELFYDFPGGVTSQVFLGKYLAGDKGISLDLSKRFKTGFRLGAFASKTSLSAEEFGEGSFDKGFYFQIPTDLFLPNYQAGSISMALHPLTKDGAAMLQQHNGIWGLLGNTEYNGILRDWDDLLD